MQYTKQQIADLIKSIKERRDAYSDYAKLVGIPYRRKFEEAYKLCEEALRALLVLQVSNTPSKEDVRRATDAVERVFLQDSELFSIVQDLEKTAKSKGKTPSIFDAPTPSIVQAIGASIAGPLAGPAGMLFGIGKSVAKTGARTIGSIVEASRRRKVEKARASFPSKSTVPLGGSLGGSDSGVGVLDSLSYEGVETGENDVARGVSKGLFLFFNSDAYKAAWTKEFISKMGEGTGGAESGGFLKKLFGGLVVGGLLLAAIKGAFGPLAQKYGIAITDTVGVAGAVGIAMAVKGLKWLEEALGFDEGAFAEMGKDSIAKIWKFIKDTSYNLMMDSLSWMSQKFVDMVSEEDLAKLEKLGTVASFSAAILAVLVAKFGAGAVGITTLTGFLGWWLGSKAAEALGFESVTPTQYFKEVMNMWKDVFGAIQAYVEGRKYDKFSKAGEKAAKIYGSGSYEEKIALLTGSVPNKAIHPFAVSTFGLDTPNNIAETRALLKRLEGMQLGDFSLGLWEKQFVTDVYQVPTYNEMGVQYTETKEVPHTHDIAILKNAREFLKKEGFLDGLDTKSQWHVTSEFLKRAGAKEYFMNPFVDADTVAKSLRGDSEIFKQMLEAFLKNTTILEHLETQSKYNEPQLEKGPVMRIIPDATGEATAYGRMLADDNYYNLYLSGGGVF